MNQRFSTAIISALFGLGTLAAACESEPAKPTTEQKPNKPSEPKPTVADPKTNADGEGKTPVLGESKPTEVKAPEVKTGETTPEAKPTEAKTPEAKPEAKPEIGAEAGDAKDPKAAEAKPSAAAAKAPS
jgi:hypothetical protein